MCLLNLKKIISIDIKVKINAFKEQITTNFFNISKNNI